MKIVVPFAPGGAADTVSRIVANAMSQELNRQVVIDNKPGANGMLGSAEVAKMSPDGNTYLMATASSHSTILATTKKPLYDPLTGFTPIADIGRFTFYLYVSQDLKVKSLRELIDLAKKKPGGLSYATNNGTGISGFAQLKAHYNISMVEIPYKGEPPAMMDLLAGRIDMMMGSSTIGMQHLKAGKIIALANVLPFRSINLPEVPTIQELGMDEFQIAPWIGLVGPAKMKDSDVRALNLTINKAMGHKDVKEKMAEQDFIMMPGSPEKFTSFMENQLDLYTRTLTNAGVKPE